MRHSKGGLIYLGTLMRHSNAARECGTRAPASAGKRSDAPRVIPLRARKSGMCAAVTAQSGKVIGAGAALDCHGGVPFWALPLCSFKAARAFLSRRFGVPEQSVAKAIAALTTSVNQLTLSLRQLT